MGEAPLTVEILNSLGEEVIHSLRLIDFGNFGLGLSLHQHFGSLSN